MKFSPDHLKKLKAHLTILNKNQSEEQKLAARERMLKLNEAKGIRVEVTDLRTNEITVYNSIRKTAEALSTDLKALRYNENIQKERGITVPFKKQYLVKIKRDSVYIWRDDGGKSVHNQTILHTRSFNKNDVEYLQTVLNKNFELKTRLEEKLQDQWVIYIPVRQKIKLIDIVGPYMHKSMLYKV